MTKTTLIKIIGATLLLTACSYNQPANTTAEPSATESAEDSLESSAITQYTLEEVAVHNSNTDCWLAIEGTVYDVTEFIASENHPGGDAILAGCGLDATELFNTRPMGSGTPHSDKARSFLPGFEIGELVEEMVDGPAN